MYIQIDETSNLSTLMFIPIADHNEKRNCSYTSAVVASPYRAIDLGGIFWNGTSSVNQQIEVAPALNIGFGSAIGENGLESVAVNYDTILSCDKESIYRVSENRLNINVYPMLGYGSEPCFLSSNGFTKHSKFSILIDIKLESLYELADVQALLDFHQTMAESHRNSSFRDVKFKELHDFARLAQRMYFREGQYLPATIQADNASLYCVIYLKRMDKNQLFKRAKRFHADIHIAGELFPEQIHGKLFRDVYWQKNG